MAEGDELPDEDYRSIYGPAMEWARFLRRLAALERKVTARAPPPAGPCTQDLPPTDQDPP